MGKDCKFECFKGYQECKSIVFTDSVGNSFTVNISFRSYCHGTVSMNWDSVTITLNGTLSPGVFTGNTSVPSHFGSKYNLGNYVSDAFFNATPTAGGAAILNGIVTFSGTTPVFKVLALNTATTLTVSTALTLYAGSATWAQD